MARAEQTTAVAIILGAIEGASFEMRSAIAVLTLDAYSEDTIVRDVHKESTKISDETIEMVMGEDKVASLEYISIIGEIFHPYHIEDVAESNRDPIGMSEVAAQCGVNQ